VEVKVSDGQMRRYIKDTNSIGRNEK